VLSPLDNPIWQSLTSRHADLALTHGQAVRYPAEVAPFAAIPTSEASADLNTLVQTGETVGMVNVTPSTWEGWEIQKNFDLAQYAWDGPLPEAEPEAVLLTAEDLPKMLELTALVYPAYFRKGTAELGDYFGIFQGDQLCAMAGIRMAFEGHQEISAVCTHPDHRGKGYASRLTLHLVRHIQSQGNRPFLHTEFDNKTARRLYERVGFKLRATLPFFVVTRVQLRNLNEPSP